MVLGGPLPHVIAAKAVAFAEARKPEFASYAQRIVVNAHSFADALLQRGVRLVTGGTDNHLVLMDTASSFGLTGRQAEAALLEAGVVTNRNAIPNDGNGPWYTSGIRMGTPALTTLGMGPSEFDEIAEIIVTTLRGTTPATIPSGEVSKARYDVDGAITATARSRAADLLERYPLYPNIELDAHQPNGQ